MASPTSCMPASPAPSSGLRPRQGRLGCASRASTGERRRSRRWDEARTHRLFVLDLDHPRRALVVAANAGLDHAPPDEVLDQLPDQIAMRAQDDIVELGVVHELVSTAQPAALREGRGLLDVDLAVARQRLDGLHAAEVRARVDRGDLERLHHVDQALGLLHALPAERPDAVVALPVAAAAGLRVANEEKSCHYLPTDVAMVGGPAPAAILSVMSAIVARSIL